MISAVFVLAAVSIGSAKDLSSTGLEEAFIDAVGTCGPSSNIAGAIGKSADQAVQMALRRALFLEAADDAAGVAGKNASHAECLQKELSGRGYTAEQMDALPDCVSQDWPGPLTSLGDCVKAKTRLSEGLKKK
ncbi:MAG TPA: hypothetical protein VNF27_09535 [Candidatus Binataceae bacterium]|nr:hypothetical protein [Candidatus Binataceae bacterium]